MATAKIATLAIRTLAKPIASQIKHQAQSHQRFRAICISLAQFMHRTEMALRSNLLAPPGSSSGEKAKVRPLNEAKAVTNGSNALAEGFLFALAAALIVGESYRGSRSRAKQRDQTEEGLEELTMVTKALAEKMGVNYDEIERRVKEMQEVQEAVRESEDGSTGTDTELPQGEPSSPQAQRAVALRHFREEAEKERDRLQHAINVLLRLALRSGWIQGEEGLHLQSILDGTDEEREKSPSHNSHILTHVAQSQANDPSMHSSSSSSSSSSAASSSSPRSK
ncbi:hypothetical protein CBS101457_001592 [Exobasidium rhododendri]|nr:hypothetical protein CBS101457_001592 [Exobasidium rhododendri]